MATIKKPEWAVHKHAAALGTEFAKCATCPGTKGTVVDGKMGCSRAGASVVWLTPAQVQGCDGKRPFPLKSPEKKDVWPPKTATRIIGQLSVA